MPIRLIIFDCDGVLFDSRYANEAFYNHIRRNFHLPPLTPAELEYVHMATAEESVNYIIPDATMRVQAQDFRISMNLSLIHI